MSIRQISAEEFGHVSLRVHTFMTGVPLHDVWTVELPKRRSGALLAIRLFAGRLFGWDR